MKKRNLLMLGLIALMAVVVFVSCMQDPILDNKAIGKWQAKDAEGDMVTIDVKSDQTFTMTEVQPGATFALEGTWNASSVSQGTMTITALKTTFDFTAYDTELTLYRSGEEPFTLRRLAQ